MEAQRWDRIKVIFSKAAEKPVPERAAFLDQACSGDSALRREVEKLLGQLAQTETVDIFATQPRHALQRGDVLADRFRILRFIGKGGMGEVYEANDQELGGPVALKILKPGLIGDAQFLGRFRREVQLARQVTHPNVCRVFDVGHDRSFDQERVFITMELLDGETLADHLLQSGRLSTDAALPLITQMADGLDALHQKGIIHRDFKPANVLVIQSASGTSRAVISDFGLARALDPDTSITNLSRASHILGTPDYMAPEQLLGAPVTHAADIYALGLVMYEMVTGKKAFPGGRALENAVQRVVEQPSPPQEHSAG
ncbi:MAG: serine/threonine-protein kinase, partial [Bryobacteraceae bacterium]